MIISHKYKFIFIKSRKTGGTSVEVSLAMQCGKDDIITGITDYSKKSDENFYVHSSRNYEGFNRHIKPDKIRVKIGDKIWNSYFKFTIVRNPWDFAVSMYKWQQFKNSREYLPTFIKIKVKKSIRKIKKNFFKPGPYLELLKIISLIFNKYKANKKLRNFDNFVKEFSGKIKNTGFYFDSDGKPLADYYIRFEELEEGYKKVCEILKIPYQKLPRLKTKLRKKGEHYSSFYNNEAKGIVAEEFKKEIEFFGYRFEVEENL
jgi:hypothetical protein